MSADDIEKGTRWRSGLASELEQSSVGIICLTPENLDSTWIHFEAGALSKQQQNTYVCTFLFGIEPTDVKEPLAQFQATRALRSDVQKLMFTINNTLGDSKLPEAELNETFEVWWPKLEQRLNAIEEPKARQPQRDLRDMIEEVLELTRFQARLSGTDRPQLPPHLQDYAAHPGLIAGSELSLGDAQLLANYLGEPLHQLSNRLFGRDAVENLLAAKRINQLRRDPTPARMARKARDKKAPAEEAPNENSNS